MVWVVKDTPRSIYSGRDTRYTFTGGWVGPHGQSGRVRNMLPKLGFNHQTAQFGASRSADYASPSRTPQKAWAK